MEALKPEDMMGYKSPRENMKTNVIDKLIGVKTASYKEFEPMRKSLVDQQKDDFKLKFDKFKNEAPYDIQNLPKNTDAGVLKVQDRKDMAYNAVDLFVPGYSKAGKWYHKAGAAMGIGSSKRAIARARRHHIVNHVAGEVGNQVAQHNPDVDPNLVRGAAGLAAMGVNKATDAGANKYRAFAEKKKKLKEALKKK